MIPTTGRYGGQRLVSHLSDGARFRRPHAYEPARHQSTHRAIDAGDQSAGLQLRLDGQPIATPLTFSGVVGIARTSTRRRRRQGRRRPTSSSPGPTEGRPTISTPAAHTTYTAAYRAGGGGTHGLSATYFNNADLAGTTLTRVDPTVDFAWGSRRPRRRSRPTPSARDGPARSKRTSGGPTPSTR